MTKFKKIILPLLLGGALLAGSLGFVLSAAAGEDAASPAELWSLPAGVTAQADVSVPDYMLYGKALDAQGNLTEYTSSSSDLGLEDWQKNGIKITADSANRWVEYKHAVDISSFTADDVLFAFTPLATARGNADFNEFNVKITDAEDESNYLLIKIKPSQWFPATFTAETAEAGPYGYQYGDYRAAYEGGLGSFNDKYHVGFDGTTNESALVADKFDKTEARHRSIILHYDFEDKAVWVTGQQGIRYCIMDMDWSESVGYGKEWKGFSSGKVYLSFCSKQHRSGSPSYMVLNAFNTPMNGAEVDDTAAPVFSFGEEVNGSSAPSAVVGREYTLPAYECIDAVDGETAVTLTVTDPSGDTVSGVTDAFTPQEEGRYTLAYITEDAAGNDAKQTLYFAAQKTAPAVTVSAAADTTDVTVGEQVRLPEAVYTAAEGAYVAETAVRVLRAGYPNETVEIEDGIFVPLFAGEYRAVYTATDWLGLQHTQEIVYTVTAPQGVVSHGGLQQLRRLFDGVKTALPELYAYDYTGTPGAGIAQDAVVTLSGNGQQEVLAAGSVFTPSIEKFGTELTVTYTVGAVKAAEYTVEIREKPDVTAADYVNDGSYQLDDYIVFGDGVSVDYNEGDAEIKYYHIRTDENVTGDRTFGFANPLRADGFSITFAVPANMRNFSSLTLSLRDSYDSAVGFDLELDAILTSNNPTFKEKNTFVTTNGGTKYAMTGTFNYYQDNKEISSSLTLVYRDGCIYDVNGNEVCKITQNFDGRAWNGFPSGKAYFDVTFEDVGSLDAATYGSRAAIALTSLCGQAFYVTYSEEEDDNGGVQYKLMNFYDLSNPQIVLEGELPTDIRLGQKVSVPAVSAYDALSPYVELTVTVQAPDGSAVYSNAAMQDGMSFTVDQYGLYYIRYTATDATGNYLTTTYTLGASDTTAPTIALSSYDALQGSVGGSVTIPTAVVQDDRDEAPRLFVYVIQPDASSMQLGEATAEHKITSFTPTMAGRHTVVYYAIDSDYNATVVTVTVNVK